MSAESQEKIRVYEQQRQFMEQHQNADTHTYDLDGVLVSVIYVSPIQKWKTPIKVPGSPFVENMLSREWFASSEEHAE
jgi:hypothetical protein